MKPLSDGPVVERVKTHFISNYSPLQEHLPNSICTRCRNLLLKVDSGKCDASSLPDPVDVSTLELPVLTRSSGVFELDSLNGCSCFICIIARANPKQSGFNKAKDNFQPYPLGRPPSQTIARLPLAKPVTVCSLCFQMVGRGIPHPQPCGISRRRDNLAEEVMKDARGAEQVASSVLKRKAAEAPPDASSISLATKGRDLPVPLPSSSKQSEALFQGKPVPASEFAKLQSVTNMSYNQLEQVAHWYRVANGRNSVEAGLMKKLKLEDNAVEDFFSAVECEMDSPCKEDRAEGKTVKRSVVYCTNITGLLDYLREKREFQADSDLFTKVGIDGGGAFLKVCMTVEEAKAADAPAEPAQGRSSYNDGAFKKELKFSGVKRLLVIGIVEAVCENFNNTKTLMDLINLNSISFSSSVDMKMANCLLGLGTAASTYPCPWCEQPKKTFASDLAGSYNLRSFASIKANAEKYMAAVEQYQGQSKLSSAKFLSCERLPLLIVPDDDQLVIDALPPMELHLFLGVVNHIYNHLDSSLKAGNCSITAADWSVPLGMTRAEHYGGQFNGNQCQKLLDHVDRLETLLKDASALDIGGPSLDALRAFNEVVAACFKVTLQPDFQAKIKAFEACYLKLDLSVTPKVHAVCVHVPQFLQRNGEGKKGLGYWSEQASESVHRDWDKLWVDSSYKRALSHKDYQKKLLACAIRYNSRHT